MKFNAVALTLAVLSTRCRSEISSGGTDRSHAGVALGDVADYTALLSQLLKLSPSTTSEINGYIDELSNTTNATTFDFYSWDKYKSTDTLAVAVVCPGNSTDNSECAAFVEYNDKQCSSASVCPFESGTKKKEVTADCAGINTDFPSCSFKCAIFDNSIDSAAFNKCFASSFGSPTSAPANGPTSSAPFTHTQAPSMYAIPLLLVGGSTWLLGP